MIGTNDIGPTTGQDGTATTSDDAGGDAGSGERSRAGAVPQPTQQEPVGVDAPAAPAPRGTPTPTTAPPEQVTVPSGRRAQVAPRRSRVVVRRLDPWSVLKFSLLFYFCLMLIVMFALMILFWIMGLTGVLDSAGRILQNAAFGPPPGKGTFRFDGVWIFQRLFGIGAAGVVVWSLVNFLLAFLYNLVSDVVGGVSVTLTEKR